MLWANWILAMSAIGGWDSHPLTLTRARTSTGAPQWAQLVPDPSLSSRQNGQV